MEELVEPGAAGGSSQPAMGGLGDTVQKWWAGGAGGAVGAQEYLLSATLKLTGR